MKKYLLLLAICVAYAGAAAAQSSNDGNNRPAAPNSSTGNWPKDSVAFMKDLSNMLDGMTEEELMSTKPAAAKPATASSAPVPAVKPAAGTADNSGRREKALISQLTEDVLSKLMDAAVRGDMKRFRGRVDATVPPEINEDWEDTVYTYKATFGMPGADKVYCDSDPLTVHIRYAEETSAAAIQRAAALNTMLKGLILKKSCSRRGTSETSMKVIYFVGKDGDMILERLPGRRAGMEYVSVSAKTW